MMIEIYREEKMKNGTNPNREGREDFRDALLTNRSEDEYKSYDLSRKAVDFYHQPFRFEDERISGKELLEEYVHQFPADRDYSNPAELNRMFSQCDIPQVRFYDSKVLQAILGSLMTPDEWERQEIFYNSFEVMPFIFQGSKLQGQMLQKKFGIDLQNSQDGTFYRIQDYNQDHSLSSQNPYTENIEGMRLLFETAGLTPKTRSISEVQLNPVKLREILLSLRTPQEWTENTEEVRSMKFDIPGIRAFSGLALKEAYSTSTGKSVSIEGLFNLSGVPYGNRIAREENFVENYQRQMSEIFENPNQLRESLLEIMSKEEWAKPKPFVEMKIRARPIDLKGRQMDLHTLMCNYSTYEYNKNNPDDMVSLGQAQDREEYSHIPLSSKEIMDKICAIAGITSRWIPDLGDFDLHDSRLLSRLVSNATYQGIPVSPNRIREMKTDWRKVDIVDEQTGLKVKLRTLVQNHSAFDTWRKHYPNETLNTVAIERKIGKVNQNTLDDFLRDAGV